MFNHTHTSAVQFSNDCLLAEELRALIDGKVDPVIETENYKHLDICTACTNLYFELPLQPSKEVRTFTDEEKDALAHRLVDAFLAGAL